MLCLTTLFLIDSLLKYRSNLLHIFLGINHPLKDLLSAVVGLTVTSETQL